MAKEDKRKIIMDAARELFFDYGYRRTSVNDITKKARVAKGTFYLYFKSKGELFGELWVEGVREAADRLTVLLDSCSSPTEKFRKFLESVFNVSEQEWSFLGKCLSRRFDFFNAAEELEAEDKCQGREIMRDIIRQILVEGIEKGEFRNIDVERVSGVVKGTMTLVLFLDKIEVGTHLTPEEFVEGLSDMFLNAIKA